jgi:surface polysaccharide O-acyltransferase-like enzyme
MNSPAAPVHAQLSPTSDDFILDAKSGFPARCPLPPSNEARLEMRIAVFHDLPYHLRTLDPNPLIRPTVNAPLSRHQGHVSIWQYLLQIAGAVIIVAFHTEAPFSQAGWVAVELFFVMAGMHMASALRRDQSILSYAGSRIRRLLPEVAVIWAVTLAIVLTGHGTRGMFWFLGSAPLQLQNITPLFFRFELPRDAVFGPLWFVAALFQLQVLMFAIRHRLGSIKPGHWIAAALAVGMGSRLLFAILSGHPRTMDGGHAGILYCMPFCHLEAMVLGVLLGRGDLPKMGRKLPYLLAIVLLLGLLNVWLSAGRIKLACLGFEFPMRTNFGFVWAYPALAFAFAALCAKDSCPARFFDEKEWPPVIIMILSKLATYSFGVYCFHGLIISSGLNAASSFGSSSFSKTLVFCITLAEAFAMASIFSYVRSLFLRKNKAGS